MREFSKALLDRAAECEKALTGTFARLEENAFYNTRKVMGVFADNQLSERHFNSTVGYGYNDDGRDLCDKLFAQAFGCEAGFARASIISGTHALAIGLQGLLRPGDVMVSVTGKPYDTLSGVIGLTPCAGSLAEFGVKYEQIDLVEEKTLDLPAIKARLDKGNVKMIYAQRSKGYSARRTLTAAELTELGALAKQYPGVFFVVDNCYGEFVEKEEPKADLLIGSLIKNPGGGMAESGGYLVGSAEAVELASYRLTVPGIGLEAGATLGTTKQLIKGLFYAPHTVLQAMKTSHFAAAMFESYGYHCNPTALEARSDIIQTVDCKTRELLLAFCGGIQAGSPVDSYVTPEGWTMPGYNDEVVMAAGAFVQGSSIELSADAPIRPPFRVYMQGGLTYESGKYGILTALEKMGHG